MNVWQTCFLVPGLTRSECASWVQAWGSILAIFAAVILALWQQRRLRNDEKTKARARAEVVGTSMLLQLPPVRGGIAAIRGTASEGAEANNSASVLLQIYEGLPFPTEADMLILAEHDRACARTLLRARNLARQAELMLRMLTKVEEQGKLKPTTEQWKLLEQISGLAEQEYDAANKELEKLVPN